jgi:hypothetical protein
MSRGTCQDNRICNQYHENESCDPLQRDLSCQQIEIHNIEAVSSFTCTGTELTRENEEEIEIHNIIMSANKALLYNCDLHAENINSEYTRIYMAIILNTQDFKWTSTMLWL